MIDGCRNGDSGSQKMLVDSYSPMLFTICIRYMGDRESAKDALQETLIKILNNINRFDPKKGKLEPWLRTIAINTSLSTRKKIYKLYHPIDEVHNVKDQDAFDIVDNLQAQDLLKLVKQLPEGYRQIFNLSVIDGYPHTEIATMLGISESTSRSQLLRSKKKLKQMIISIRKNETWKKIS